MHHRLEPFEVRLREIANVFPHLRHLWGRVPELTARKQVCIQANHVMAGGSQERSRHGADIAFMAGQQYSHTILLRIFVPVWAVLPSAPGNVSFRLSVS